jgi:TonB family protein
MGDAVSTSLPDPEVQSEDQPLSAIPSEATEPPASVDLLVVLRQSLAEGSKTPASIMDATTEVARVMTGADGVALALRTKGLIVCRARSGEPTPALGAPLNTDSGISGECIRAASIMLCRDTANDPRVDPEVCRAMGIGSIVVVPLRGPSGVAGILEAFSTRAHAFGDEQINSLRALAEIVEAAYDREYRAQQDAAFASLRSARTRVSAPAASVSAKIKEQPVFDEPSPARRYWVIGIAAVALLLFAGVWLSGRESTPETAAAKSPQVHGAGTEPQANIPELVLPPKPKAGIARSQGNAAGVLKNAAEIEDTSPSPTEVATNLKPAPPVQTKEPSAIAEPSPEPPPVMIASATLGPSANAPIAGLATGGGNLPTLDAKVSQGVTEGKLIRKVEPNYPMQARAQHIAGTVALEITIAEDGTVRNIKEVSGSPVLAAAARSALQGWRYSPFLLNGKPVAIQKQITFIFRLP